MLFAQVVESLQRHLFRGDRIASLLKKNRLRLIEIGIYRWIKRIKILAEGQNVELVAALMNCLRDRSSNTAAFVAQKREQSHGGATKLGRGVDECRDIERSKEGGKFA